MRAITALENLEHRGANGADPRTGDGAGILMQIPHRFFARECSRKGIALPPRGEYGIGMLFLPRVWRRLARNKPRAGQAWDPAELAIALRQNWLARFGLGEGICVLGGMGYYLAYQQGLLGVAQRTWMLGLLPLGALAWMLMNWPDDERLKAAYLNS